MTNRSNKEFTVKTVSGKELLRKNCRYIAKEYHEINVDCFQMEDGRWHRKGNGKIEFDHEVKTYVLVDRTNLKHGVINVQKDGSFEYGYFSSNDFKNVVLNNEHCISEEILNGKPIEEELSTGNFYTKGSVSKSRLNKKGITARYPFRLDYSASFKLKEFTKHYNDLNQNDIVPQCRFTDQLGNTSFGFEFETINGMIPVRKLYKHGLIPLRDGSLRHDGIEPFEYTTIPLSDDGGINTVINVTKLLKRYTEFDTRCALHVHEGGYKPSKEFVVALQRLMMKIQDEIYSLFPANYKYTSENGFKQKDYCSPMKNVRLLKSSSVNENFNRIYDYYSGGAESFRGFGAVNHPMDRDQQRKWGVSLRYNILNIIPFIWGHSGTLEWRVHPPTNNVDKIINWLFISNGILKYVDKHKESIANFCDLKSVSLDNIIADVYSNALSIKLINYMNWRKKYMKSIDAQGRKEIATDDKPLDRSMCVLG